jgi:hypothetical protein
MIFVCAPERRRELACARVSHRTELWSPSPSNGCDARALQQLLERLQQAVSTLSEEARWLREVLFAGWTGGQLKEVWHDLLAASDRLTEEAAGGQRLSAEYGPELPADPAPEALAGALAEIVTFLEGGGSLGFHTKMTQRTWHRVLDGCRIDGRKPQVLDEYRALRAIAQLRLDRTRFVSRWRRVVEDLGGPAADSLGSSARALGWSVCARDSQATGVAQSASGRRCSMRCAPRDFAGRSGSTSTRPFQVTTVSWPASSGPVPPA